MTDKTKKLQSLLTAQVGKGGLHNIVAAVQSVDQRLDFVRRSTSPNTFRRMCRIAVWFRLLLNA